MKPQEEYITIANNRIFYYTNDFETIEMTTIGSSYIVIDDMSDADIFREGLNGNLDGEEQASPALVCKLLLNITEG